MRQNMGGNSLSQAKFGSMHVYKYADQTQQGISQISSLVSYFSLLLNAPACPVCLTQTLSNLSITALTKAIHCNSHSNDHDHGRKKTLTSN